MVDSKMRPSKHPGAVIEEVVRRKDDPRSASVPPEMVRQMGLDARLMAFLLSERPPLQLGSAPPAAVLDSIPPEVKASFRAPRLPAEADDPALARTDPVPPPDEEEDEGPESDEGSTVERVRAEGIGLPAAQPPAPPPPPRKTPEIRAKQLVKQLEFVGPGDEAPVVQALLRIGEPAIDAVADAFPGLLWFHRHLPHVAVPRGRDISPLARTLVAFGAAAQASVERLLEARDADKRFYALLVAQDLGAEAFVDALPRLATDPDRQVREIAAATLLGLPTEVRSPAREVLERLLVDPRAARVDRIEAVHALARLREGPSIHPLVEVVRDATHRDLQQLAAGALTVLTGQPFGVDPEQWHRFADKRGSEPRIEWLVDALRTTHPEIVEVVLRELAELTGEAFGDPAPDDTRARKKVASAYAKWWKQNGSESVSLFGRLIRRRRSD